MPHVHTLKLAPADLDRLHAVMVRAAVSEPDIVYSAAVEIVTEVELLARTLASQRLTAAVDGNARDGLRRLADLACDHLAGRVSPRMLAEEVIRVARQALGERTTDRS